MPLQCSAVLWLAGMRYLWGKLKLTPAPTTAHSRNSIFKPATTVSISLLHQPLNFHSSPFPMARTSILKLARLPIRNVRPSSVRLSSTISRRSLPQVSGLNSTSRILPSIASRSFSSSIINSKGITPESSDPRPKIPESHGPTATAPTEISIEEYHQVSDDYMDTIVHKLEQLQEAREDVDVEFSVSFSFIIFLCLATRFKASSSTIIRTSTFHSQT